MGILACLLIMVLVVAVLVCGYYLGIFFAALGALLTLLAIGAGLATLFSYVIWELWQERKRRRR